MWVEGDGRRWSIGVRVWQMLDSATMVFNCAWKCVLFIIFLTDIDNTAENLIADATDCTTELLIFYDQNFNSKSN